MSDEEILADETGLALTAQIFELIPKEIQEEFIAGKIEGPALLQHCTDKEKMTALVNLMISHLATLPNKL
jgi:hypothetical protein